MKLTFLASYAELGAAIPLNGGAYAYLTRTYSPLLGFLFLWSLGVAVKPCGVATISTVFAQYVNRVIFFELEAHAATPVWANKLAAIGCVWTVTLLHAWGSRVGVMVVNLATVIKVLAVGFIAFVGIVVLCIPLLLIPHGLLHALFCKDCAVCGFYCSFYHPDVLDRLGGTLMVGIGKGEGNFSGDWFAGSTGDLGRYAVAMFSGLWAYAGILIFLTKLTKYRMG